MLLRTVEEFLDEGYRVLISEEIQPDSAFITDEGGKIAVFHPLNYNYLAYRDIFTAHEKNMDWINNRIEDMATRANMKLDEMVYEMNHRHDPVQVNFFSPMYVTEDENGVFTFTTEEPEPDEERYLTWADRGEDILREGYR